MQFIALEGLNSGVPTRTTPTLTPTTLRNIEQTFIELQSKPEPHENEAGFVPPLVHPIGKSTYTEDIGRMNHFQVRKCTFQMSHLEIMRFNNLPFIRWVRKFDRKCNHVLSCYNLISRLVFSHLEKRNLSKV